MKKFMFAAVVAFWASVFTLWGVANLAPAHAEGTAGEEKTSLAIVTLDELAKHDTAEDCWMAINGKVYDFSEYIPEHPAPPAIMTEWCGKEATEAYRTKGYGRKHSKVADSMLPEYLVGELQENRGP
ncbi:MAG: cytochrome b5-like heme/steroid binding domain-containing protein [Gammaproteobacteria bacterium]|nr:cytochrome b5-like heme/steroid binding domain-containing protein [Gammaproteobacteria bacterium]